MSVICNFACCAWNYRAWRLCRSCGGNRRVFGERRLGLPVRCATCKQRDDVKFVWCYHALNWKLCASNGPAVGVRAENVIGVPAENMQPWRVRAHPDSHQCCGAPKHALAPTQTWHSPATLTSEFTCAHERVRVCTLRARLPANTRVRGRA